jgi:hypothetical protein
MNARGTITLFYALTGAVNAVWGATLPATDARLDLGAGLLGVVLTALAAGALVAMPFAGWLAARWGGRRLLRLAAPAAALAVAGPAAAPSVGWLVVAAVAMGVASGVLNVALSIEAIAVERALGRPVMATLHGTWTLGAVTGGAAVTTSLHHGVGVQVLMTTGATAVAVAMLLTGTRLRGLPGADGPAARVAQEPAPLQPRVVVMLGVVGAAAFITEGAATDWAGVHATRVLGADAATGSLVYTVFFVAMTLVRFVGDAVRARAGAVTSIRLAGWTATAGAGLVLLSGELPGPPQAGIACAIAGWALAGAGMAVVWPIVTSTLGAAGIGAQRLSAVTTISYGGGLVGPAVIGYVAGTATLPAALIIPAVLAFLVATVAPRLLGAMLQARTPDRPSVLQPG